MLEKSFFFCGIGGSGMLPLAVFLRNKGCSVTGSDRSFDNDIKNKKMLYLKSIGINIVKQDGMGLNKNHDILVVSPAIEDTVPEMIRAKDLKLNIKTRPEILGELFNNSKMAIGVAGTSGKSTTTAMIGWAFKSLGLNPSMINGAPLCNLVTDKNQYAAIIDGNSDIFVTECDESGGGVVLYKPNIAVLTNISLDHMSLEELFKIFKTYLDSSKIKIVNIGCSLVQKLLKDIEGNIISFAIDNKEADFTASNIKPLKNSISCEIIDKKNSKIVKLNLKLLGRHNIENALACIAALSAYGISLEDSIKALSDFIGVKRRLETIGIANNITVFDDFGHNPEKIEATLKTLHESEGRLLVFFQMHGYGPLRLMKKELMKVFGANINKKDKLYMPDVLYFGGTTDKSYSAEDFCNELKENYDVNVMQHKQRKNIANDIIAEAKSGDRIVIMGARDDSLSELAENIVQEL